MSAPALSLPVISLWAIIGMLPLLWLAQLPPWWAGLICIVLAGCLCVLPVGRINLRYMALALLCFAWALLAGQQVMWPLAHISRKPHQIQVRITETTDDRQLQADIIELDNKRLFPAVAVRLTSHQLPADICAGQRWHMQVMLRPEHGQLNNGGFDRQRHALAQHRVLNGRILSAQPVDSRCNLRAAWLSRILPVLQPLPWGGVIVALGFGERTQLSQQVKVLLHDTSTAHLMAISGLHIGFAALLGSWLVRLLQWLLPAHCINPRLPLFGGLLVALLYTWVSGANAPAQRSLVALICWGLLRLSGRQWHPWQVWLCCLAAVLFIDPLSVISDSFWLSAFAVATLIFWYQWMPFNHGSPARYWRYLPALVHLQLGIMLLLLPLQLLLFHGISLSAIPANMLAVPLITFITLPLILAGMLLSLLPWPGLAQPLWWLADQTLALIFYLLSLLPMGWVPLDARFQWLTLLPWLAIILWRLSYLLSAASALVALLLLSYPLWRKPAGDDWALHMLDLGAAQAIVIERYGKAVLYDSGTAWPGGDSVQQTLLPWLHWHYLTPEAVILSNLEFDQRNSLRTLRRSWPQLPVITADPNQVTAPHHLCARGQRWYWQGLLFQAHWPLANNGKQTSVSSASKSVALRTCIISVSDGKQRVLLTGRLDKATEQDLLRYYWNQLQAQVMLVPVPMSNHASSDLLLNRVNGQIALASLARTGGRHVTLNKVKQRYAQHGYSWYDTAHSGQVTVRFSVPPVSASNSPQIITQRQHRQRRWYHNLFVLTTENNKMK